MFFFQFLTLAAFAAPVSETTFEFVGQPECVSLEYADGQTLLNNACAHALLLDQSVVLSTSEARGAVVPADTSTRIRDLSAFTLGMNGTLYRVVAIVAESAEQTTTTRPRSHITGAGA